MERIQMKGGQATRRLTNYDLTGDLEEKILRSRESFFDSADNWLERKQNEEVQQRENNGNEEFDYKKAIPILIKNLSSLDDSKRERIIRAIERGVSYRITGIYVDIHNGLQSPLLAEVAQAPEKYFNCI